jgi:hypothetical protein
VKIKERSNNHKNQKNHPQKGRAERLARIEITFVNNKRPEDRRKQGVNHAKEQILGNIYHYHFLIPLIYFPCKRLFFCIDSSIYFSEPSFGKAYLG